MKKSQSAAPSSVVPYRKVKEIYEFEKHSVKVLVLIDYAAETISLVENKYGDQHRAKPWVFAGRELTYMNGWRDTLDAMKHAIGQAEQLLKEELERQDKLNVKKAIGFSN